MMMLLGLLMLFQVGDTPTPEPTEAPPTATVVVVPSSTPAGTVTATRTPYVYHSPVPATPLPTATPACVYERPCYYYLTMHEMSEFQGAELLGTFIFYCLIYAFVKPTLRIVLMLALLFACGLFLITLQEPFLYGWMLFSLILGGLTNVFKFAEGTA